MSWLIQDIGALLGIWGLLLYMWDNYAGGVGELLIAGLVLLMIGAVIP